MRLHRVTMALAVLAVFTVGIALAARSLEPGMSALGRPSAAENQREAGVRWMPGTDRPMSAYEPIPMSAPAPH
jgi:hypothetical protein